MNSKCWVCSELRLKVNVDDLKQQLEEMEIERNNWEQLYNELVEKIRELI